MKGTSVYKKNLFFSILSTFYRVSFQSQWSFEGVLPSANTHHLCLRKDGRQCLRVPTQIGLHHIKCSRRLSSSKHPFCIAVTISRFTLQSPCVCAPHLNAHTFTFKIFLINSLQNNTSS